MKLITERPTLWAMAEFIAWAKGIAPPERSDALEFPVLVMDAPRTLMGPSDGPRVPVSTPNAPPVLTASLSAADQRKVIPLVPKAESATPDRISVGRADRCDLVLPFSSISKLHAYLHRRAADVWEIEDAGSTQGTLVDGEKLTPGKRAPLRDQARISFAEIPLEFRSATAWRDRILAILNRM